ncbi:alpha/beta hydrolase [uncultured Bacteroides sp.]|uniref:alpha/beta fold hydrolase n=1 Tax=uncultured Bacteroides sp. TaxID=162156 RepID=UPI002AAA7FE0|nr:alpha/beta hydrolase [uncultured Bacteroides sp.]
MKMQITNTQLNAKSIRINNEEISYIDSERGDVTLVFIHGAFIDKGYWAEQIAYFSPRYRVVAMDLAGHGNSTHNRSTWNMKEYGKDVSRMIQALSLKNVVLIGHSMGTSIMLETVAQSDSNIIGLIGVDNFKNLNAEIPQEMIDGLCNSLRTDFANTCGGYASAYLMNAKTEKQLANKLIAAFRDMNPTVGIPVIEDCFRYSAREKELLKVLKLKLNLINVNYFPTDEDALKQYVGTNYTLSIMNGTCHYPMIENSAEFNALLDKLLLRL